MATGVDLPAVIAAACHDYDADGLLGIVRAMLDAAGDKRGRRLSLAIQLPCHQWQAYTYGQDVKAWVDEGIVDYLLPTQPNNVDCNLPIEQWMETVEGTGCRIFPTIHPHFRFPWSKETRATLDSLRAAAHLYYRQGAHGLSTVNMFDALQNAWFNQLRDPEQVAAGPHHYHYTFDSGASSDLSLRLDHLLWRISTPIRIVDDPESMADGKLVVTIENLQEESRLDISVNGQVVPRPIQGATPSYPAVPTEGENLSKIEIPLSQLKLHRGQNDLAFGFNTKVPPEPGCTSGRWKYWSGHRLTRDRSPPIRILVTTPAGASGGS